MPYQGNGGTTLFLVLERSGVHGLPREPAGERPRVRGVHLAQRPPWQPAAHRHDEPVPALPSRRERVGWVGTAITDRARHANGSVDVAGRFTSAGPLGGPPSSVQIARLRLSAAAGDRRFRTRAPTMRGTRTFQRGTHEDRAEAAVAFACSRSLSCGGGGGNAALSRTFTYGARRRRPAPSRSPRRREELGDRFQLRSGQPRTRPRRRRSLRWRTISPPPRLATSRSRSACRRMRSCAPRSGAPRRFRSARTSTPTSVTFNNCTDTESRLQPSPQRFDLVFARSTLTWNMTGGFSGSDQGVTFSVNIDESGSLTVTATTVKGNDALRDHRQRVRERPEHQLRRLHRGAGRSHV